MILHIPHSARLLPKHFEVSKKTDLQKEFERITDWYTDELFDVADTIKIVFPYSRLYCDVERFRDDKDEEMALKGMGVCYEKNSFGNKLRDIAEDEKEFIKSMYYDKHHTDFTKTVESLLHVNKKVLIIDCHSFSNEVLPHEKDSTRPDFCIGTDNFHTPKELIELVQKYFIALGYKVSINKPFQGTIVPLQYYGTDENVSSIMIEINRKLYLTNKFERNSEFEKIKNIVTELLNLIKEQHE